MKERNNLKAGMMKKNEFLKVDVYGVIHLLCEKMSNATKRLKGQKAAGIYHDSSITKKE